MREDEVSGVRARARGERRRTHGGDDDGALGGVVAQRPGLDVLASQPPHADDAGVRARREVVRAHVLVPNVEERVAVDRERRSLAVELEDDESRVVACEEGCALARGRGIEWGDEGSRRKKERTSGKEVQLGVRREDPEPIVLPPKRLHRRPLAHVPDANRLVLGITDDELVLGVEERDRDVVEVSAARIDLPRLGLAHPPELDLPVVAARDDEGERRVERSPVDSAVVALEDVLDDGVRVAKEVGLARIGALDLLFKRERLGGRVLLAEACARVDLVSLRAEGRRLQDVEERTRNVPHAHGLIHRSRNDVVLLGVELSAPAAPRTRVSSGPPCYSPARQACSHDVVVVAGENGNALARLPVPDPDRLVVGSGEDPGVLVVEVDGADVVEVTVEGKKASAGLVAVAGGARVSWVPFV